MALSSLDLPLNDPYSGEKLYDVSYMTVDDCLAAVESAWKNVSNIGRTRAQ